MRSGGVDRSRRMMMGGGLATIVALGCRRDRTRSSGPAGTLGPRTIVHAGHVLDADGGAMLDDRVVVIEDGLVTQVEPAQGFEPGPHDTVVDARSAFVVPGLTDAHGHPPDAEPDDAITMAQYLELCLSAGVTCVRSCRGTPAQIELRDDIAEGAVRGPRLVVGGPVVASSPDEATQQIDAIAQAGYDFVKLMHCEGAGTYDAVVDAVRRHRLPFTGHVPADVGLAGALAARQSIEHLDAFGAALQRGASLESIAADTKRSGITVCPTQTFLERWWQHDGDHTDAPGTARVPAEQRARWQTWTDARVITDDEAAAARANHSTNLAIIAALQRADVPLLASASHGPWIVPGWSMLDELRLLERAGIPRAQVLATAMRGSSSFARDSTPWGRIAPGHHADLLVLDADPLADLAALHRVRGIVRAGSWHPAEASSMPMTSASQALAFSRRSSRRDDLDRSSDTY